MECVQFRPSNRVLFSYHGKVFRQLRGLPQGACDSGLLATMAWFKYMNDVSVYMPLVKVKVVKQSLEEATLLVFTVEY